VLKLFVSLQTVAVDATAALRRREDGQTMAEYGVVLAVITLAVIAAISLLSDNVRNALTNVANVMPH
jgi:Flp pilus assembly pilin Flp